jgi:hypothetical protein
MQKELLEKTMQDTIQDFLTEKTKDFEIINKIKSPIQVSQKIRNSMMKAKPKINNHDIKFSKLSDNYNIDDKECSYKNIETKETTKLPAVISNEIRASGVCDIEWTNIKSLPMGMDKEIRTMGSIIFQSFGLKEGADILTISALKDNDLLNSNLELNSLLSFLEKNTQKVFKEPATQLFDSYNGNEYKPKIQLYYTATKAYLAVFEGENQGIEGKYIYTFERDPKLSLKNDIEKLDSKKSKLKLKLN